jgi:hypothetical protein
MIVKTKKGDMPVHFGMNTMALFGDLADKSMNEAMTMLRNMSKAKLSDLLKFFYAAFVEGAKDAGEECLVSDPHDVGKLIDEDPDLMTHIFTAYTKQSTPEDEVEKEGKKK